MSKKRNRKKNPSAKGSPEPSPASQHQAGHPRHQAFSWLKGHKLTVFLVGLFTGSLSGPVNYFGSKPIIFYLPTAAFWALLTWGALAYTHKYVNYSKILHQHPESSRRRAQIYSLALTLWVLATFGLFSSAHNYVARQSAEIEAASAESSVSVSPYAGTNQRNPLSTDFVLSNIGSFTIENIKAFMTVIDASTGGGHGRLRNVGTSVFPINQLRPGDQSMIQTGFYGFIAANAVDWAEFAIDVEYSETRNTKKRVKRSFHFVLKKDPDTGAPRWFPIAV